MLLSEAVTCGTASDFSTEITRHTALLFVNFFGKTYNVSNAHRRLAAVPHTVTAVLLKWFQ